MRFQKCSTLLVYVALMYPAAGAADDQTDCLSGIASDAAVAACTRLIEVHRTPLMLARHYRARAGHYREMGDFDHAIADYTEAIRFELLLPEALVDFAATLDRLGEFDRAAAQYREAIRAISEKMSSIKSTGLDVRASGRCLPLCW